MARFGIGIPQVLPDPRADVAALHRFLRRAEHLGFESAWLLDQPIGTARVLEPTAVLAHAAAVTTRIRLGTAVLLLPLRIPFDLAKSLATIDQLSGGRLNAGVALGAWQDRYPAFGLHLGRRVRRFEEAVGLLKRLWTEPSVTADGEFWQLDGVSRRAQAASSSRTLRCGSAGWPSRRSNASARLADAWMGAGSATTAAFAAAHAVLVEALEAEGRDPSTFPVGKRVYVAVDADRGPRALATARVVPDLLRPRRARRARRGLGPGRARSWRAWRMSFAAAPRWSCSTRCSTRRCRRKPLRRRSSRRCRESSRRPDHARRDRDGGQSTSFPYISPSGSEISSSRSPSGPRK